VLTELARDGRPVRPTAWERIPELEGPQEYQDAVVGFWQWTSAGMYYAAGVNVRPYRDESVTVYTPAGHVAVVYPAVFPLDARWGAGPQHADAEAAVRAEGHVARVPAVTAGIPYLTAPHRRIEHQRAPRFGYGRLP
jgi:hypothetical protein